MWLRVLPVAVVAAGVAVVVFSTTTHREPPPMPNDLPTLTADEIGRRIQDEHPEIALSTVYRSLDALAELGVLEHVHMGHGPAVYHLTHERHVHLVCRGCGVVLELTDDALTDVAAEIERTTGFVIEPSHFAINGRCAACAATT